MSNVNEITGTIKEFFFEQYQNVKQGYTPFKNEDVLFAKITPCMENGNCVIVDGLQNNLGFGSTEFIVFRIDRLKLINKHIYQFLRNMRFLKKAENFMIGAAGQRRISSEYLKIHPIAIPTLPEQTAIATYLDRKTSAIDCKVALLEQKITHYQQLRKSLINETVCRGLDKTVKLKESGIEWIGMIPEHWEVKRLKDYDTIIMGQSPSSEDYNFENLGFPFLQGNAEFGEISPNPSIWCNTANKVINENDILVSVRAPIGAVNIANQIYGIGRGLCAIMARKSTHKFLYYHFLARKEDLNSFGTGTTYIAISLNGIRNLLIAFPPLTEQVAISTYLDEKTQKIDSIVSNIKSQIETLKELRNVRHTMYSEVLDLISIRVEVKQNVLKRFLRCCMING